MMKKSDLKNRMVVEYRNGERRMVIDDMLMGNSLYGELRCYDDNLNCIGGGDIDEYDIVKVFNKIDTFREKNSKDLTLFWERSEVKEVTMSEVEEKFGCKVKIVKE